ncbi:aldehyde dehydrogenase [Paracidovorax avenae]|uniref:aldehyde dehydrogenase family protein n=1 Tax=Paracidovorax avenae TaxID=80867 RepID=UPI000D22CC45|nr:aldehyde dehydrogenase family protein [Paracidovorax avenae]AVS64437.1 aldehyde dehydrogenase [Paracidovorax avenae]
MQPPAREPCPQDAPEAAVRALFDAQAATALALRSSDAARRLSMLRRLHRAVQARRERWYAAFRADLGKPAVEVELTELLPVLGEAGHAIRHLQRWMRPRRVGPTLATIGTRAQVQCQPRGRCLIIGPWNYPLNTVLGPLVSAVAAGNTAIVKPSEFTPHVNALVAEVIAEVFDPTEVALVEGGVATATHLLALPFDHIFFTGSPAVGQVVMAAASRHLASVTLELGGKSPAIVDASADLPAAARMLAWGKLANAGQTCVAPDHVLVHRSVAARFAECWREAVARHYGRGAHAVAASPDLGRMVSVRHAARVAELVDDALARGAVALDGGTHDAAARYVAPTLLADVPEDARIETEEIFGPVMPLRTFDTLDEAIARANAAPKPLALYIFSRDREAIARVAARTSSGSLGVNLCVQQYAHAGLPFGGVNRSGLGSAHGWHGFRAFSHERACLADGPLNGLRLLFPPYTRARLALARLLVGLAGRH